MIWRSLLLLCFWSSSSVTFSWKWCSDYFSQAFYVHWLPHVAPVCFDGPVYGGSHLLSALSLPRFPLVEPSSCLDSFSLSLHLTLSLAAPPSSCPPFCLHAPPLQDFQITFLNTLLFHSCFLCFSTVPCTLLGEQLCLFLEHCISTTWDQGGRSVHSCWRIG